MFTDKKELDLTGYILNCIGYYRGEDCIERSKLIAVISDIAYNIFSENTPFKDLKQQHDEINSFCELLKFKATLLQKPDNQ